MTAAAAAEGSSTKMGWKRRSRAGSFSMCFLYSAHVVAATVLSSPRASAGLRRLAASPVPAAPPAPMRVWASSINRRMGRGESLTAWITRFRRSSNAPFTLAPAWSRARSSARRSVSRSASGTSPSTMRRASPSTTAVLPTPASPTNIALFFRRRRRTSVIWRISRSRPKTGSISPARARAVTSVVNSSSGPPAPPCAAAPPDAAGVGGAAPSAESWVSASKRSRRSAAFSGANASETPSRPSARAASRRCPDRTSVAPWWTVAAIHACCTRSSRSGLNAGRPVFPARYPSSASTSARRASPASAPPARTAAATSLSRSRRARRRWAGPTS